MVNARAIRQTLIGRQVAAVYAIIVALYLVRHIRFQPIQIPAYLLIVAYDFVEMALPVLDPYHPIGFPLFLYLLAVVAAAVTRWTRSGTAPEFDWTRAAGGVCVVVGAISLLFAAFVGGPLISATDNPTPLAITATTGTVLVLAGWWLLRGRAA